MEETDVEDKSAAVKDLRPFQNDAPSASVYSEGEERVKASDKVKSLMDSLFGRNFSSYAQEDLTQDEKQSVDKAFQRLEARLGNAGRACVLAYHRWGEDFWNMPQKDIITGLIESYWARMLSAVGKVRAVMKTIREKRPGDDSWINFPPLNDKMQRGDFQEPVYVDYLDVNCQDGVPCQQTINTELGLFRSVSNSVDETLRGLDDQHLEDWKKMVTDLVLNGWQKGDKAIVPRRLKKLFLNAITNPSIDTWANAMAGLIVFKYYIDMRFTPSKNMLWEKPALKEAKRFFRGQMYLFWKDLDLENQQKNFISKGYYENGNYPREYITLISFFTLDDEEFERQISQENDKRAETKKRVEAIKVRKPRNQEEQEEVSGFDALDDANDEMVQDKSSEEVEKRVRKSATRKKAAKAKEKVVSRQEKFTFGSKLALTMDDLKQFGAIASAINVWNQTLTSGDIEDIQQQAIVPIMRQIQRNENLSKALDVICAIKRFDPIRSNAVEFNQKMIDLLGRRKEGGDASSSSESSGKRSEVSIVDQNVVSSPNTPQTKAPWELSAFSEDNDVEMQEASKQAERRKISEISPQNVVDADKAPDEFAPAPPQKKLALRRSSRTPVPSLKARENSEAQTDVFYNSN